MAAQIQNLQVAATVLVVLLTVPFALVIRQYERFGNYSDYGAHIDAAQLLGE